MARRCVTQLDADLVAEDPVRERREQRFWSFVVGMSVIIAMYWLVGLGLCSPALLLRWAWLVAIVAPLLTWGWWTLRGVLVARQRQTIAERFRDGQCFECGYDLRATMGDQCPECGIRDFRLVVRQRPIPPPWQILPFDMVSACWRMGAGLFVMGAWQHWYDSLRDEERQAYAARFPETMEWPGFYDREERRLARTRRDGLSGQSPVG